ncbi:enoyl-CoA hydratase-related protein [Streptomyces sp. NPDC056121]|uniref:enoyl-CoA hydratase-related protein n=1 Tax=Streptomyces sp. NPDC056121 TaxID=3345718 RepID=UPI0035DCF9B3
MDSLITYDVGADGVATVTLDSPHNRNALSRALLAQLHAALAEACADARVRALVLTAAGPVFCSGADLKEDDRNEPPTDRIGLADVLVQLTGCPKPVVARVAGRARAGGLGLIAACDLAVAADSADFAFSEVRIGVVPAVISAVCLPLMDRRSAQELLLTGAVFDAARAVGSGLLTASVPDDALDRTVTSFTEQLVRGGPDALAGTKALLDGPAAHITADDRGALMAEFQELSRTYFASAEAKEGIAAFRERRSPDWPATPTDRR